jgi:hypothetical protein
MMVAPAPGSRKFAIVSTRQRFSDGPTDQVRPIYDEAHKDAQRALRFFVPFVPLAVNFQSNRALLAEEIRLGEI